MPRPETAGAFFLGITQDSAGRWAKALLGLSLTTCVAGAAFFALLVITAYIYWPGLAGDFILDDIPNLEGLGQNPHRDNASRLLLFVLTGYSGTLGRPLAMASFLINDYAWPTDPRAFKYTNVLLHLLNGVLVYWIAHLLTVHRSERPKGESPGASGNMIALLVAALWLLHPLNVSTVLYIVQRMTITATLFMLAGVVFYLKGRRIAAERPQAGYALMSFGVVSGTGLGFLCKEIAALLPLLLIVLEYTVVNFHRPRHWRIWSLLFLGLPTLLLLGWHVWSFSGIAASYVARSFTMEERLLTQSRTLISYLGYILLPRREGTGIFTDDFPVSHGLWDPPVTLLSIFALAALVWAALRYRRRLPWVSFGILWFMAGHALEAGIVPLELYFEHRNYLPMIGPLFAIGASVIWLIRSFPGLKYPLSAFAIALVALEALATHQNTTLWGSTPEHAEFSFQEHPASQRAAQFAAQAWLNARRPDKARDKLVALAGARPESASVHVQILLLNCALRHETTRQELEQRTAFLRQANADTAVPGSLQLIVTRYFRGGCPGITLESIHALFDAVMSNPRFQKRGDVFSHLFFYRGNLYALAGDYRRAAAEVSRSLDLEPTHQKAFVLANLYSRLGEWDYAKVVLRRAETINRNNPVVRNMFRKEIEEWDQYIERNRTGTSG